MTEIATEPRPALPWPRGEWTFDDLEALPDDGHRYEIVEGALYVSPSPLPNHQYVVGRLIRLIEDAAPRASVVLTDVTLNLDRNVFRPDVLVVTAEAFERNRFFRAPDLLLAVEVTSPSSRSMDRIIKPNALAAAGVPSYWRVDLEGDGAPFVEVYRLQEGGYRLTGTARSGGPITVDDPFPLSVDPGLLVR